MTKCSKCVVSFYGHRQQRDKGCIYAKFPKNIERRRAWLKVVGETDLVLLPQEKLNEIRYVCGCHFTDDQFSNATRKRLTKKAVPSIFDNRIQPLDDALVSKYPLSKDNAMATSRNIIDVSKEIATNTSSTSKTPRPLQVKITPPELSDVQPLAERKLDAGEHERKYTALQDDRDVLSSAMDTSCQKDVQVFAEAASLEAHITPLASNNPNGIQELEETAPRSTPEQLIPERSPFNDVTNQVANGGDAKRYRPSEQLCTITVYSDKTVENGFSTKPTLVSAADVLSDNTDASIVNIYSGNESLRSFFSQRVQDNTDSVIRQPLDESVKGRDESGAIFRMSTKRTYSLTVRVSQLKSNTIPSESALDDSISTNNEEVNPNHAYEGNAFRKSRKIEPLNDSRYDEFGMHIARKLKIMKTMLANNVMLD